MLNKIPRHQKTLLIVDRLVLGNSKKKEEENPRQHRTSDRAPQNTQRQQWEVTKPTSTRHSKTSTSVRCAWPVCGTRCRQSAATACAPPASSRSAAATGTSGAPWTTPGPTTSSTTMQCSARSSHSRSTATLTSAPGPASCGIYRCVSFISHPFSYWSPGPLWACSLSSKC